LGPLDLAMPASRPAEGEQTPAQDALPEQSSVGHTTTQNLPPVPDNHEPVELITALGVFDPNLVFASAVDIDFQNQWVCTPMHNKSSKTTLTLS